MSKKIEVDSGVLVTYMGPRNYHFILSPSQAGQHYAYGAYGSKLKVLQEDEDLRPDLFVPDNPPPRPAAPPNKQERVVEVAAESAVAARQSEKNNEPETEIAAPDEAGKEEAKPAEGKDQRPSAQAAKPIAGKRGRPKKNRRA